ncbi:hypothetical protein D0962_33995 [Leptolyngbyaceae cyanobacterium CCMR0082]|uniref:PNPLA domain-containing protein n=1 Tax=Adonisia turfae CCMR0082 TaxID=2304604 RepID=A0A6M0SGS2_9CYAN|nr:patatin-like phospholipase family protein [Adonisia turfae]NEZ67717.1 hypothetical protein [Adonisia turfae CCMR0082]
MSDKFFILACDGGGIRGLASAKILAELEKRLKERKPERALHSYFKLIAGTSTGSIIACGLANGSSADKIQGLYRDQGIKIFPKFFVTLHGFIKRIKSLSNILGLDISEPIYQDDYGKGRGLNPVLKKELGEDTKFGDLKVQTLVTSYDTLNQHFVLFDSKSKDAEFKNINLWEIARASSAAPIAFPAHLLKDPTFIQFWESKGYQTFSDKGQKCIPLIDGGLAAGNPSICALAERLSQPGADISKIVLVSLGTGINPKPDANRKLGNPQQRTANAARGWGFAEWTSLKRGIPILRAAFDGSADATDLQVERLLPKERYFRFQPEFEKNYQSFNANPDELDKMVTDTTAYLNRQEIDQRMNELVELLLNEA